MADRLGDDIVDRTETQGIALEADEQLRLVNFCHPEDEDGKKLVEFTLGDVVMLTDDGQGSSGERLQEAMIRELCCRIFYEVSNEVSLISTSQVSLATVEKVLSTWLSEFTHAVSDSANQPYGLLDESRNRLLADLKEVCKPSRSQIERHISECKPRDLYDDSLGWLKLNDDAGQYEAEIDGAEDSFSFSISIEEAGVDEQIGHAREVFMNLKQIDAAARQFAASELLPVHNDVWLRGGQSGKTVGEFISSMTLTSVSVKSDGEFELWYDDGNLFWGHAIRVTATGIGEYEQATVEG